jgi:hypothetical protein
MPAQVGSPVTTDLGDYLQIVYSFDNSTTVTEVVPKDGILSRDIVAAKTKAAAGYSLLESADTNWATLTALQKDQAARLAVRCSAAFCRFVLEFL